MDWEVETGSLFYQVDGEGLSGTGLRYNLKGC